MKFCVWHLSIPFEFTTKGWLNREVLCPASIHPVWVYNFRLVWILPFMYGFYPYHLSLQLEVGEKMKIYTIGPLFIPFGFTTKILLKSEVLHTALIHIIWVCNISLVKKGSFLSSLFPYHLDLQHKVGIKVKFYVRPLAIPSEFTTWGGLKSEVLRPRASIYTIWVYNIRIVKEWSFAHGLYPYNLGLQHKVG